MARANRTVLLVEDDGGIREAVAELLRIEGWDVVETENGLEALAWIERERPAVIVLDLMMPVMDGHAFLEALPHKAPDVLERVPILVLTAAGTTMRMPSPVREVLRKPIEADHLLAALEAAVAPTL